MEFHLLGIHERCCSRWRLSPTTFYHSPVGQRPATRSRIGGLADGLPSASTATTSCSGSLVRPWSSLFVTGLGSNSRRAISWPSLKSKRPVVARLKTTPCQTSISFTVTEHHRRYAFSHAGDRARRRNPL